MINLINVNMELTLGQFCKKVRAVRFVERTQVTAQFSHTRQCSITYFVYVCVDTLSVINPYTKNNSSRKYISFRSQISDLAKEQAYNYIKSF